jgi:hypothetical protein
VERTVSITRRQQPPFRATQQALRVVTERLARELSAPAASTPQWSDFEWDVARAVATLQGVSVLLANRVSWVGPDSWRGFLQEQTAQSLVRHRLTSDLLARMDCALRTAGIPVVALKGAALRGKLYAPGERPMGDIDLLVAPRHMAATEQALATLNYSRAFANSRHVVFAPQAHRKTVDFGEHAANPLKVEVHTLIAEALPVELADVTDAITPGLRHAGINEYPSSGALMAHLLLHAAGNMRAHALRFVQLIDIARLAGMLDQREWSRLEAWWAHPPLALAAHYFPGAIPRDALEVTRVRATPWLRRAARHWRLSDVSWSNLRIHALPGVHWARSAREATLFARSRFWPARTALRDLQTGLGSHPALASAHWYNASHSHRILWWLVSRPRRVQTMIAIEHARLTKTRATSAAHTAP